MYKILALASVLMVLSFLGFILYGLGNDKGYSQGVAAADRAFTSLAKSCFERPPRAPELWWSLPHYGYHFVCFPDRAEIVEKLPPQRTK